MKKIIVLLLTIVTTFVVIGIKVNAAETDAAMNGFTDIEGFEYVSDKQTNQTYIEGSKYTYGYISLRTFYYKFYDSVNDNMYYLVMSKATICGNGDDDGGFYSSKSMEVVYTLMEGVSTIQCYAPESQSIGMTVTKGFNVSVTANNDEEVEIQIGYTHETTYNYNTASTIVTQESTSNSRKITFKTDFLDYDDNDVEVAPYVGEYIFRSSAVFKIANYSRHLTTNLKDLSYVKVELNGEIHKKRFLNNNDEDASILHSYYNSSNGRSIN